MLGRSIDMPLDYILRERRVGRVGLVGAVVAVVEIAAAAVVGFGCRRPQRATRRSGEDSLGMKLGVSGYLGLGYGLLSRYWLRGGATWEVIWLQTAGFHDANST